ncbi:MAG: WxcM-like domain-containing protein, partial [Prevotella sp.]|nr:WxcM-like domain-containing protein [Prevotella sp.]
KRQPLNQPHKALYIPESVQRSLENLSADAICLILSAQTDGKGQETQDSLSKEYTVSDCSSLIKLSGSGTSISEMGNIPFGTKRVFYIYDIPTGKRRGSHAHKFCHEILIAVNGSFEVELDDGADKKTVTLDNPAYGLHIPPGIWAVEKNYSQDVICLVLASDEYDPYNYINAYSDFIKYRQNGN